MSTHTGESICDAIVSLFPTIKPVPASTKPIMEVLDAIKAGTYERQIQQIRNTAEKAARDKLKLALPNITVSGTFSIRKDANLIKHSDLIQCDFDRVPDPATTRERLKSDPYIFAAFISPTGTGVKAFVRINGIRHDESYTAAISYFQSTYQLEPDESCSNVSKACFISHDPDLWINKNAQVLPVTLQSNGVTEAILSLPSLSVSAHSVVSVFSVLSVKGVGAAIESAIPTGPIQNDKRLFRLARGLLTVALAEKHEFSRKDHAEIFGAWYSRAKPTGFLTQDRNQYQREFMHAINGAKVPLGETPVDIAWKRALSDPLPVEAQEYPDDEHIRKLVALCYQLHRGAAGGIWYLSCHNAAKLLEVSPPTCNTWLNYFVKTKLLRIMEKGTKGKATRYRWIGIDPSATML